MCLAVPGLIMSIVERHGEPVALVDFAGTVREAALTFLPDARPGQYVIAHAGVAIQVLDEDAAATTLAMLDELGGPGR
jgi:hydrogenase expression/formation protein HypC